ncbi:hypothetical protein N3K66_008921 [Trichothecium roseum]|uniref:Uncharacterized protein n=1 Tax=Trichothecium roseum TaxID=47278 RepID=A0ACC0URH4_9HYPO|nr:hypothetical protein N3K66_008921 [Trichothecium roseum]
MAETWPIPRYSDDGSTNNPLPLDNVAQNMAIAAFTGIAWYNVVELNVAVYMTFKRRSGLYFWSVLLAIQGVLIHSLAFILKLYGLVTQFEITVTFITIGWYLMVTGQSVVLYSRLHIIVNEPRLIRAVLIMIIWNAITLHIPTTVLTYGSNSPNPKLFNSGFQTMEKIQITIFSIQELIISGIYIWTTVRFLQPVYKRHIRGVMLQLLWINIAIIIMDIAMVATQFLELYYIEAVMKSAIYSVKLKLEFAVLNQLMRLANSSRNGQFISDQGAQNRIRRPSSARRASAAGKGVKGVKRAIRRMFPAPGSLAMDDNNFAFEPSVLQSTGSTYHQRQHRMVVSSRVGDAINPTEPPSRGIAMTTEITQIVSTERPESIETEDKAVFYHHEARGDGSLELVDRIRSADSAAQSQLELVSLPASPKSARRKNRPVVRHPEPSVSPSCFERRLPTSAPATVQFTTSPVSSGAYDAYVVTPSDGVNTQRSLTDRGTRPSVGNLKGEDGESRTSSEVGLRV